VTYSADGLSVIESSSDRLSEFSSDLSSIEQNKTMEAGYSYKFLKQENNPELADVMVNLNLIINGEKIPVIASGTINAYKLTSGETLWEGPLHGHAKLNGEKASAIIGFSKLNAKQDAQMSVTIQPNENSVKHEESLDKYADVDNPILVYLIEGDVLTSDIREEILNSPDDGIENALPFAADTLQYKGGYVSSTNNCSIYWSSNTNRAAVSVQSYTNNINKQLWTSSVRAAETHIRDVSIQLSRQGTGTSYIAGMETFAFSNSNFGRNVTISPLFEDAMGLIGIPSSTISNLLGTLKGNVTRNVYTNNVSVLVTFGLADNARFDTGELPIVFQLAKSGSATGFTTYYGITKITYRTMIIPFTPNSDASFYYTYTSSSTNTGTVNLTLS